MAARSEQLRSRLQGMKRKKPAAAPAEADGARAGAPAYRGLRWLVGSPPLQWKKQNWERQPYFLQRQSPGFYKDFDAIATPERLFELLDQGLVAPGMIKVFRCTDGGTKEVPPQGPQTAQDVREFFSKGWSLQWLQPQHVDDSLAEFVAVLESEFGCLVGVNAYLTPPGTQGLAPHYDDVEVFVLQLHGEKLWHLHTSTSETPVPTEAQTLPRFQSHDLAPELLGPIHSKPLVKQGDLLYFPRGTIHYAPNQGTAPSVHLTVSTYQRHSLYELVQKSFEEAMCVAFYQDEALRRGLQWRATAPGNAAAAAKAAEGVAGALRLAAEAAQENSRTMVVTAALDAIQEEFVAQRMPPLLGDLQGDSEEWTEDTDVMRSRVLLPDPTVLSLRQLKPGEAEGEDSDEEEEEEREEAEEGAEPPERWLLATCMRNARSEHMLGKRPEDGDSAAEEEESEEDEEAEESEEAAQAAPGNATVCDRISSAGSLNQAGRAVVRKELAAVLQRLINSSPQVPRTAWRPAAADWATAPTLAQLCDACGIASAEDRQVIQTEIAILHCEGVVALRAPANGAAKRPASAGAAAAAPAAGAGAAAPAPAAAAAAAAAAPAPKRRRQRK
eukprot:TRINITY_DN15605_c0_g1_i1.p1 TRINITY_DN15605_c0_g1~~TRINITY_DN15605_c0_g1_i1.p1  ORF type:complete len:640 (+),score=247.86 TRINITY_DN15605_c0_g1_i1:82-1920(+)